MLTYLQLNWLNLDLKNAEFVYDSKLRFKQLINAYSELHRYYRHATY